MIGTLAALAPLIVALCAQSLAAPIPFSNAAFSEFLISKFQPVPIRPTFSVGVSVSINATNLESILSDTLEYVAARVGHSANDFVVTDTVYTEHTNTWHVYLCQAVCGMAIENACCNLNIRNGQLSSVGDYLLSKQQFSDVRPKVEDLLSAGCHKRADASAEKLVKESSAAVQPSPLGTLFLTSHPKAVISPVDAVNSVTSLFGTRRGRGAYLRQTAANFPPVAPVVLEGVAFADGPITGKLTLVALEGGVVEPTYSLSVPQESGGYTVHVHAVSGKVLASSSWVSALSYRIINSPQNDPTDGFSLVNDPESASASPRGWAYVSNEPGALNYETAGNNALAMVNLTNSVRFGKSSKVEGKGDVFDFNEKNSLEKNLDAAALNMFFWTNRMHDFAFVYGFNEQAGNFQMVNYGGKGRSGDPVVCVLESTAAKNIATFTTPPDGQSPTMRLSTFHFSKVPRLSGFDNSVIQHEYAHGISSRLTGGPSNQFCLSSPIARGLSEGWSDFFALIWKLTPEATNSSNFYFGTYTSNHPYGFRTVPYSTSLARNPHTFGDVFSFFGDEHLIGEVWATMLYELLWILIDKHGFEPDLFNVKSSAGNVLATQLIIDAMKLQPCNPNFIQARDAILLADLHLTQGSNACEIWGAFAKRGLGYRAKSVLSLPVNSFLVPKWCKVSSRPNNSKTPARGKRWKRLAM